ncbi:hypothetical protein PV08_10330 [Exophiala spinifera]|uniref:AB hydrolase-1 domain-containing protein n=1 Tax=Exophiala spinifera TaxID=91928 RepID=A0A0D1Y7Z2_9EURO|nr:uncharacterized protein PV08_10330 [Exophiala spinifera]KIW11031.1 hypothetical protein PV08_10330 [Exophiala spinifera]
MSGGARTHHTQGTSEWVPTRDGRRLYSMVLLPQQPNSAQDTIAAPAPPPTTATTVIFEAGAGASRSSWAKVQKEVACFARAIVYDRSGLGRSEPDRNGRTLDKMACDLCDLLEHFGPGPFVLVGHSAGGPIVRLAASRKPDVVAGLVLVDPADEAADALFSRKFRCMEWLVIRVGWVLAKLGLLRHLHGSSIIDTALAADVRDDLLREGFTTRVMATMAQQARTFLVELETWKTNPPQTADIPTTVISGGLANKADGMPEQVRAQAIAAHVHRAAQCCQGRHVVADRSGHLVPMTEPELVVAEIRRMVVKGSDCS